ncbi:hypothetical protein CNR26_12105 [Vibrio parahaemolyticus]|nr:hypothetical protein CNR26_12105 [Vibrio parahaemolyticus]
MTIYTASREPILLAGRLTSTGFKRKPPKQKPKKAEPLAMGFGFFMWQWCAKNLGGVDMYNNSY